MARFEKGKGRNKTVWTIGQIGSALRQQETQGQTEMLPGYRLFPVPVQAKVELRRLVTQHMATGFLPADDDAKNLAASLPAQEKQKKSAPTLPIRQDVYVYNEATGFCITTTKMAGKGIQSGEPPWDKTVLAGKVIPVALIQDDPFIIRVVVGDGLSDQEQEEWVGRIEWFLDLTEGQLVICGGAEFLQEEYEEGNSYADQFVRTLAVPPGYYRATVYFLLNGINGSACLDRLAGGYDRMEPAGQWFRRARPGMPFPDWLRYWCIADNNNDPGHEDEWKDLPLPDSDDMDEYADFLVHLEPDASLADRKKRPGKPALESGWFRETAGARKPDRCPLGLAAQDIIGHEENVTDGTWTYIPDVHTPASTTKLSTLSDPLTVPLARLGDVFMLAWFAHTFTRPEFHATLPQGSVFSETGVLPDQVVAIRNGDEVMIGIGNDLHGQAILSAMPAIATYLGTLPPGATLELFCSRVDTEDKGPATAGRHRYRGTISGGQWRIEATHPAVKPESITIALSLIAECNSGESFRVENKDEADAILKWLRDNHGPYAFEDNPPVFADNTIRLGKKEPGLLRLVGSAAFAVRFSDQWPVMSHTEEEKATEDDENFFKEVDIDTPRLPIKGTKILETPSGRMYFQSMALLIDDDLTARIQKEEKALRKLGFTHVADLVCNLFENVAIRAYANTTNDTWAAYLVGAPDTLVLEMSTRFEKLQASLLTTRLPDKADDPATHTFRQSLPDAAPDGLLAAHEKRKAELTARFGPPVKFERKLKGLAESVEAALQKQLG